MKSAFEKYFSGDSLLIRKALMSISEEEMDHLIDECEKTLRKGHKIIASGLGKNVPICEKFEGTMLSLGLEANFLHTNSAIHGDMGMVKSGDLVIILTKSGATTESVNLVNLLRERAGVTLWLISFQKKSELADVMENKLIIQLENEGDLWNIVPNHSTTLNLIVLQKVAIELSRRLGLTLEKDFKPNHPGGAIGEELRHE